MKSVLFFDLDNTIYPVSSIADELFKKLFETIAASGDFKGNLEDVKTEIQRTPFEKVANAFYFGNDLYSDCLSILNELVYDKPMQAFADYRHVQELPQKKYLITSGFTKMQQSKILQLGIENDFEGVFIIDLQKSSQSKKEVFQQIIIRNNFKPNEILVVGDDIKSEIQAAKDMGLDFVIYDKIEKYTALKTEALIRDYKLLQNYL